MMNQYMKEWRHTNTRVALYCAMPLVFISGGALIAYRLNEISPEGLTWMLTIVAAFIAIVLACLTYGHAVEQLDEISAKFNDEKLKLFIEDLGPLATAMPTVKVVSHQEPGNFRWPARMVFMLEGCEYPITYGWKTRRFQRYKWPILPFSLEKTVRQSQTRSESG